MASFDILHPGEDPSRRPAQVMRAVRRYCRERYAWPGGYPLILIMGDGEILCADCARGNYRLISKATRAGLRDGWQAMGVEIHWEGPPEHCCNCVSSIASAYGRTDDGHQ